MTLMDFPTHQSIFGSEHDRLEFFFEAQRKLMLKYHEIEEANGATVISPFREGHLDDRDVQIRLKDVAYRLVQELSEATAELKNKPWKQSDRPTDVAAFKEEVVDVLHFFVEFCITAGITAEDLHKGYVRKNAINQQRQASGY